MSPSPRTALALAATLLFAGAAAAQSLRLAVSNTRRELNGQVWSAGNWVAFTRDEDLRDLNGDGDKEDSLLVLEDLRTLAIQETALAVDTAAGEDDDDKILAFSTDRIAVQVSEEDSGGKDENGNGDAQDPVLYLYDPATRRATSLGITGRNPTFAGSRLYFAQPEAIQKKDLNGDTDLTDTVLCAYDLTTKQVESLGMEASGGFKIAGDWIAALAEEAGQGAKDLNADMDFQDSVVELYQISQKKWINSGLATDGSFSLTARLLAVGVDESAQGARDANGDMDAEDQVCVVWDLTAGRPTTTLQDCSDGLVTHGGVVGLVTNEEAQGKTDLNGDGDAEDSVLQYYTPGLARPVNLQRDASGGVVAGSGKLAFVSSEEDNGKKDLNKDNDTEDYVLQVYDPVKNSVLNTTWAVDGELNVGDHYMAWKVLESDQAEKDLNRDMDTDDSVLYVMDLATNAISPSAVAASDNVAVSVRGVSFGCIESDQGDRDLNGDGDVEDEVLQIARYVRSG
jgi:hypothetical protein